MCYEEYEMDDYTEEGVEEIDFDVDELQENEDFAHDGDFDNMYPTDDGCWSNCDPWE
jgi:hypothetical protein